MNREGFLLPEESVDIQRRKAAVAAHRRGDALKQAQLARVLMTIDMTMRIDKARADKPARGVDHLRIFRRTHAADCGNLPVLDPHIRADFFSLFRIDHNAA